MEILTPDENHLSTGDLARILKRSREGVRKAIVRLQIPAAATLAGISFYPPTIVAQLETAMRKSNLQA